MNGLKGCLDELLNNVHKEFPVPPPNKKKGASSAGGAGARMSGAGEVDGCVGVRTGSRCFEVAERAGTATSKLVVSVPVPATRRLVVSVPVPVAGVASEGADGAADMEGGALV